MSPGFHVLPGAPLPRLPLAAVGYLDGTLAIYDLSTQTLRHQCQHQVGQLELGSWWAVVMVTEKPRPQGVSTPHLVPTLSFTVNFPP